MSIPKEIWAQIPSAFSSTAVPNRSTSHPGASFSLDQLEKIRGLIASGELGEIRTYKLSFGFPHRGMDDFRYSKAMGGGALLDCGGYPLYRCIEIDLFLSAMEETGLMQYWMGSEFQFVSSLPHPSAGGGLRPGAGQNRAGFS